MINLMYISFSCLTVQWRDLCICLIKKELVIYNENVITWSDFNYLVCLKSTPFYNPLQALIQVSLHPTNNWWTEHGLRTFDIFHYPFTRMYIIMLLYFCYITALFINVSSVTEKKSQVQLVKSLVVGP